MTETTASQPLPTPEQTSMAQQGKRRAAHGAPLFLSGLLCSFPLTSCPNLAVSESSNEIGWAEVMAFSELAAQSRAKVAELDKPATAEVLEEASDQISLQMETGVFPRGSDRRQQYEALLARQTARDIARRGEW